MLRRVEHAIESFVEGAFGRAFRSHVQPIELARKLAKEMDEHKSISVSRVYVPNEYLLYLAPQDRARFEGYEDGLVAELSDYLAEHARREGYALLSPPRVLVEEDEELAVGEFGIATRTAQPRPPERPAPAAEDVGETKVYRATEAVEAGAAAPARARIAVGGHRHELAEARVVLGRSRECDITIGDPNVSRQHAEIRREDGGYWIVDLGSTNGVEVNGKRVDSARLEHRDRIVLGKTELTFEQG